MLRIMAANSGWSEIGGRAIREPSDFQTGGAVIGRTVWVGKPEWARGFGNVKAITATVEKAIAGKRKLCKQQRLLLDAMLYEIEDMRADSAGCNEQDEAHQFDFDWQREQWENDQAAILEYENWFLSKTIMEADAEFLSEQ